MDAPPLLLDPAEAQRCEHTRLRRRMLYGLWAEDLRARMRRSLGPIRERAIGEPDLSANPLAAVCSGAAALYDRRGRISHADAPSEASLTASVDAAGWWPLMQRVQRDVLGLREMVLRASVQIDSVTQRPEVSYHPVPPDLCVATPDPDRPDRPIALRHAVQRQRRGKLVWTWDDWSLIGDAAFRVLDEDGKTDISVEVGLPQGGLHGDKFPVRRLDGRPRLPFVVYHAASTGTLWDAWYGREIVEGTLNVGVLWTYFTHTVRNASWPQRWLLGASIAGSAAVDTDPESPAGPRKEVVADPAVVLELEQDDAYRGQAQAGQWSVSADPKSLAEAVQLYERRSLGYAGFNAADVVRDHADPRSGYSLSVNRDAIREAQRRFAPIFAPADAETMSVTATLLNAAVGAQVLPEDGWSVTYEALPPSIEERKAERAEVSELIAAGLLSKAEGRQRLFGESPTQAAEALAALTEANGDAATSPFASVGLPALVAAGILSATAARRLLGVGEDAAPTAAELATLNPRAV
jgi:hypothetical protein